MESAIQWKCLRRHKIFLKLSAFFTHAINGLLEQPSYYSVVASSAAALPVPIRLPVGNGGVGTVGRSS
jgi:hypothetical protein